MSWDCKIDPMLEFLKPVNLDNSTEKFDHETNLHLDKLGNSFGPNPALFYNASQRMQS